ncbi:hypothetical protein like AT5G27870 [Hibiscus trionum]|uniref:Pectinesterase n=1 Tax=Hibiscus trionum TaxID=183268 RepID=A0A9W7MBG3_HIBTR|nr:hypothetical protein like AT5G27870 [Hibiscus trionum]
MGDAEDGGTKTVAIIAVASLLLLVVVVAVTVGFGVGTKNESGSEEETRNANKNAQNQISSSKKAIELICEPTKFKNTCEEQLQEEAGNKTDVKDLVQAAFKATMRHVNQAIQNSTTLSELENDKGTKSALDACKILLNFTAHELEKSFDLVEKLQVTNVIKLLGDLKIWLSATIANQQACLDGFENTKSKTHASDKMKKFLNITMQLSRNGLAIACELQEQLQQLEGAGLFSRRRLLQDEDGLPVLGHSDWTSFREKNQNWNRRLLQDEDGLPVLGHSDWTSFRERNQGWNRRRLLQDMELNIPQGARRLLSVHLKPDLVVAKDGSGDCKTINEAKQKIPRRSTKPFVVHVKKGIYAENVLITSDITHLVLVGDGKEDTRITGNISTGPGGNPTTYFTCTLGIDGNNFVAKNIGIENTAGPLKAQAVALRVQSEDSVFFNCSIDGYQDTLYAFTKRQFYRDCTISGTIDFVFGDASVIFQNCTFLVRKPRYGQQNIVTAQKRSDDKEPTGIVIHGGKIIPAPEFAAAKGQIPVYLGRPWGALATTIIMETYIDDMVQPEGWTGWSSSSGAQTCTYLEFHNRGPGSSTSKRVKWPGVQMLTEEDAARFLPPKFFAVGDAWIKHTGVPYTNIFGSFEAKKRKTDVVLEKKKKTTTGSGEIEGKGRAGEREGEGERERKRKEEAERERKRKRKREEEREDDDDDEEEGQKR